jgi:sugar phosphate isomerase/epimerase
MPVASALALDHLTAVDTTPSELVSLAGEIGCGAVCMFMEPMAVLPLMPPFALYGITQEARETKSRMAGLGVGLDLVYPFTLAGRTDVSAFQQALETAAWLGAGAVNVLLYDRDPARRFDNFAAFCRLAQTHDLDVALEFYSPSQCRSLAEALDIVTRVNLPGQVGINVDLLHLMRSGGLLAELAAVPAPFLRYAQYCDGPAVCDQESLDAEASSQRRLPGDGVFDLVGFTAALPSGLPVSVELPQNDAVLTGVPVAERARRAVAGVRRLWGRGAAEE